jgi:hypothetical protein
MTLHLATGTVAIKRSRKAHLTQRHKMWRAQTLKSPFGVEKEVVCRNGPDMGWKPENCLSYVPTALSQCFIRQERSRYSNEVNTVRRVGSCCILWPPPPNPQLHKRHNHLRMFLPVFVTWWQDPGKAHMHCWNSVADQLMMAAWLYRLGYKYGQEPFCNNRGYSPEGQHRWKYRLGEEQIGEPRVM